MCVCLLVRLSALELVQGMLEEEELVTPTYSAIMSAVGSHLETSSSSLIPWKVRDVTHHIVSPSNVSVFPAGGGMHVGGWSLEGRCEGGACAV